MVHRRDRRQQPHPRGDGPGGQPVAQHRPLVHHRRPLQDAVPDRALDLGRRAVQRGPRRLAAPDGRRRLAARLPDGRGLRPGDDQPARGRRRAAARPARPRRRVRVRLDRPLPVPRPPARDLPRRPHPLHRRRGARGLAVRRARRQQRHPGRGQPRLEAGAGRSPARPATTLLDSYHAERHPAAVENLTVCRRTARFLAPRSRAEHRIRRAVCTLARRARVRAPPRQHRPDGAGQRLSAVAVGEGRARARCRTSPSTARR